MEQDLEDQASSANKRSLRLRTKHLDSPSTESHNTSNTSSTSKRSSRSRDPEFAARQKAFLQKVVTATNGSMDTYLDQQNMEMGSESLASDQASAGLKRKLSTTSLKTSNEADEVGGGKRRKSSRNSTSGTETHNDCYCWICHKEGEVICCETCPRVFHLKCIQLDTAPTEDWVCPECVLIMTAENMDTRSRAMRLLTVDQLCVLLRHALARMRTVSSVEPFAKPVDPLQFPAYKDYVFCPMDLSSIEKNIKKKQYGSTEAFLADIKWILHNCIIFNSTASKLTSIAKSLIKVCKHEMQEIENCPDCYLNAHARKDSWFVAACRIPHLLVWAKLKGFPFWPAKAMRINSEENVDVRFFGAHDRAWIPVKDVFLYSEEPPVVLKNKKRGNLDGCMHEVDMYIKNITEKFGKFQYADFKTNIDSKKEEEQIKLLYPTSTLPFELGPRRRARTYSFSGSERSHTNTPTPSEAEANMTEDESQTGMTETEMGQTEVEEDLEQAPEMPGKGDLEDELLTTEDEEAQKLMQTAATTEEAAKQDQAEEEEQSEQATAVKVIKAGSADRAAASPPCEVSSTTLNNDESKKTDKETEQKTTTTEVVAETNEAVEIQGADPAQDEEEIDDVEEEIDDEEPVKSDEKKDQDKQAVVAIEEQKEKVDEPKEVVEPMTEELEEAKPDEKETDEVAKDTAETVQDVEMSEDKPAEEPVEDKQDKKESDDKPEAPQVPVSAAPAASSEEEIDDEEPELVIEEDEEETSGDNVERLAASGVSVTVIDKKKKAAPEAAKKAAGADDKKGKESIGLSSDISVTVVHKKKIDLSAPGPKISVKKESELLQDPKKDIVEVTRKQSRKPSVEIEPPVSASATSGKAPPDPIVTISKVSNAGQTPAPGASLLKPSSGSAPKTSSPAMSRVTSMASTSSALNSLASILGQGPRMSTSQPSPVSSQNARFPGRSLPSGPARNSSPLMMAAGPFPRPPNPMPSLHPRPLLGMQSVTPPVAGPVSEQLNKVAGKLVDFMRGTLEELFKELSSQGSPEATIKALQIEMEKMQWRHQQELAEVKHNADLLMMELRQSMEAEKQKVLTDFKKQADIEKHKAVAETKKKQWCAHCGKEAIFYCCWNTSYCDYPCQQAHWPTHMSTCAQNQSNQDEDGAANDHGEGSDAVQHFLATSQANGPSRPNGLGSQPSRGIQGNPMMMPFGPQSGLSPRMMNQLNMMAAAAASGGPHLGGPRGSLGNRLRFPGSYFM